VFVNVSFNATPESLTAEPLDVNDAKLLSVAAVTLGRPGSEGGIEGTAIF
jgi:hypothetical protein